MRPTIRPRGTATTRLRKRDHQAIGRGLTAALATALIALAALAVPAAAGASLPGDHLWGVNLFNLGGSGDESAAAVATDAALCPIVAGDAITSGAGDFDIR